MKTYRIIEHPLADGTYFTPRDVNADGWAVRDDGGLEFYDIDSETRRCVTHLMFAPGTWHSWLIVKDAPDCDADEPYCDSDGCTDPSCDYGAAESEAMESDGATPIGVGDSPAGIFARAASSGDWSPPSPACTSGVLHTVIPNGHATMVPDGILVRPSTGGLPTATFNSTFGDVVIGDPASGLVFGVYDAKGRALIECTADGVTIGGRP